MSPYVLNTWYPLTWSRNVGRALSAHQIVEQRVVLYRTEAGQVVAMEDACPHRKLPLSMGRIKGDAIECGYHGLTFDDCGRCIDAATQDRVPPFAQVRSYRCRITLPMTRDYIGAEAARPGCRRSPGRALFPKH